MHELPCARGATGRFASLGDGRVHGAASSYYGREGDIGQPCDEPF